MFIVLSLLSKVTDSNGIHYTASSFPFDSLNYIYFKTRLEAKLNETVQLYEVTQKIQIEFLCCYLLPMYKVRDSTPSHKSNTACHFKSVNMLIV